MKKNFFQKKIGGGGVGGQELHENDAKCPSKPLTSHSETLSLSVVRFFQGRNFSLVPFQRLARNVQGHFFKNSPSANDVEVNDVFLHKIKEINQISQEQTDHENELPTVNSLTYSPLCTSNNPFLCYTNTSVMREVESLPPSFSVRIQEVERYVLIRQASWLNRKNQWHTAPEGNSSFFLVVYYRKNSGRLSMTVKHTSLFTEELWIQIRNTAVFQLTKEIRIRSKQHFYWKQTFCKSICNSKNISFSFFFFQNWLEFKRSSSFTLFSIEACGTSSR